MFTRQNKRLGHFLVTDLEEGLFPFECIDSSISTLLNEVFSFSHRVPVWPWSGTDLHLEFIFPDIASTVLRKKIYLFCILLIKKEMNEQ